MLDPTLRRRATRLLGIAACCLLVPASFAQNPSIPDDQAHPSGSSPAAPTVNKVSDAQVEANVLKALASASHLTTQPITTNTTYGVVTLTGSVATETLRTEAENIVSRTAGVQKVVDELTLTSSPAMAQSDAPRGSQLPSAQDNNMPPNDGNLAPVPQGNPESNNTAGAPEYHQPYGPPQRGRYPQQAQNYPQPQAGYPQYPQQQPYPQSQQYPQQYPQQAQPPYPQQGQPPYPQQQPYPQQRAYSQPPYPGQQPGQMVTIPAGALIRVRINQTLDSGRTEPGTTFDGTVVSDLVAEGAIAIPRGATVSGVVVNAKKSGVLAGRGEMSLQLTQVTLGGQVYPLASDVWAHSGSDKTIQTVNSTAVGAGLGAVLGAVAGGGAGAAIGAGVGGGLGLGSSASSGRGQVFLPAESMLTFHLTQPTTVATLSEPEMDRLAHAAPAGAGAPPPIRRRVIYPTPYPYGYPYPYYRPYFRVYPYPFRF